MVINSTTAGSTTDIAIVAPWLSWGLVLLVVPPVPVVSEVVVLVVPVSSVFPVSGVWVVVSGDWVVVGGGVVSLGSDGVGGAWRKVNACGWLETDGMRVVVVSAPIVMWRISYCWVSSLNTLAMIWSRETTPTGGHVGVHDSTLVLGMPRLPSSPWLATNRSRSISSRSAPTGDTIKCGCSRPVMYCACMYLS